MIFCIWLLSLDIVYSIFNNVVHTSVLHSVLWLNNLYYMNIPYFAYPLIIWWTVNLFSFWWLWITLLWIFACKVFTWKYVLNSLGYTRSGIAGCGKQNNGHLKLLVHMEKGNWSFRLTESCQLGDLKIGRLSWIICVSYM